MPDPAQNGTEAGLVSDAVRDLEKQLRAQGARRWLRRGVVLAVIATIVVGLFIWRRATRPPPPARYTTEAVEKRDIVEQVQSTGTVKPLTEVQVGAQVSGRIVKVYVDFNSKVKKGDLLAEIDPSLFGAQVSQSQAQLRAAQATIKKSEARLKTSSTNLKRLTSLRGEGIANQSDLDAAQGERDVAEADLAAAKAQTGQINAQLSSARTTLAYARIFSPIDGIVVNRAVDSGQTVAASFSAPVMFVIAQDLSKMQVLAEIDEADVGKLREQMGAEVVVDAFQGEKFQGTVTQVRYSPNNVQGVVTYSAVIEVSNPDLKLRPGMTATVTIKTREAKASIAVRNSALRFRPAAPEAAEGENKPPPPKPPPALDPGKGRIYLVTGGPRGSETLGDRQISLGITDGIWTEVKEGALEPGTEVVVEQREEKKKKRLGMF